MEGMTRGHILERRELGMAWYLRSSSMGVMPMSHQVSQMPCMRSGGIHPPHPTTCVAQRTYPIPGDENGGPSDVASQA